MANSNSLSIRMAELADAEAILGIYAPYITDTTITFEVALPTVDEVRKKMVKVKRHFPYLVATAGERVVGFAYADRYRTREAYSWNAEVSIYVAANYHGRGLAKSLYTALFQILKMQGFCNVYAIITLPNEASVALHKHFGFSELAVHKAAGFKMGCWCDVLWMSYRIDGCDPELHGPPLPMSKLKSNQIETALQLATALLIGAQ